MSAPSGTFPDVPPSLRGLGLRDDVPLAPLTTLELGGPARLFLDAPTEDAALAAVTWADSAGISLAILGGGSNVLVADTGFDGLVVRVAPRALRVETAAGGVILVCAAAGEPFDDVVAWSVSHGLAGLECLSGIPGLVGATPVQNVGAYGQEVADCIRSVRAFDRASRRIVSLAAPDCGFAYRHSRFKREGQRFVVLSVTFELRPGPPRPPGHEQLRRHLEVGHPSRNPDLAQVRTAVLDLRRRKSMVLDPTDPNHRSVGSFFTNPLVSEDEARSVADQAVATGQVPSAELVPRFPAGIGMVKLSAAWLIEHAGVPRGLRQGPVGVSSNHVLALVHHGGGTTAELLALAAYIQERVQRTFGVALVPEAVRLGACA